jgi:hypothetical protein
MGGMVGVSQFLQDIKRTKPEQHTTSPTSLESEMHNAAAHTGQEASPDTSWDVELLDGVKTVGLWVLVILLIAIGLRILYVLLEKAFRYGYAFINSRRLIFLKVLLPRGDGKSDREQEKELAKDMKEKI